jgi:hypothetical protein
LSFDYDNIEQFAEALGGSETVARCAVEKTVQHAYGRELGSNDADLLSEVYADFGESGRSYRALIQAIATHPEFQLVEVAP